MTQPTPARVLDELTNAAIHAIKAAIQAGQTALIDEIAQDYFDAAAANLLTGTADHA